MHLPIGIVEPPEQFRRLHEVLIHLCLIAGVFVLKGVELLSESALAHIAPTHCPGDPPPQSKTDYQCRNTNGEHGLHSAILLLPGRRWYTTSHDGIMV